MNIHLSSATIQSYENKNNSMDLFYNPIVIFQSNSEVTIEELLTAKWRLESETIGNHEFDIHSAQVPSVQKFSNETVVEFRLSKKEVPFSHDNYLCKIVFNVTLDLSNEEELALTHEVLGVVKTKWSKNLV